ncbi:MAG: hypothetical protein ACI9LV_000829 [Candidatus Nanohaloarchaea archaeon]|jgi:hypothetical protein
MLLLLENNERLLSVVEKLVHVTMKCKVCGRTTEELEEEFGNRAEITEHQGMNKCTKCIREYNAETQGDRETEDELENKDWKDKIMA